MHISHDEGDSFFTLACAIADTTGETVDLEMAPARRKVGRRDLLYFC